MIILNENTKCLVQGITGKQGQFHTEQMIKYNTKIVAGVTPGKGGQEVCGVPVFMTLWKSWLMQRQKALLSLDQTLLV